MEKYIYSTYDAGALATFDNHVYVKVGETFLKPDRSCKEADIVNIRGMVFNRDDNNSLDRSVHKQWTDIEMAISNLPQFTSRVWQNPTLAENSLLTPMTLGEQVLDLDVRFVAKADGIVRVIVYNQANFDATINIKINRRNVKFELKANATQKDANAYKVIAGDIIEIPNYYSRVILLPYEFNEEVD